MLSLKTDVYIFTVRIKHSIFWHLERHCQNEHYPDPDHNVTNSEHVWKGSYCLDKTSGSYFLIWPLVPGFLNSFWTGGFLDFFIYFIHHCHCFIFVGDPLHLCADPQHRVLFSYIILPGWDHTCRQEQLWLWPPERPPARGCRPYPQPRLGSSSYLVKKQQL
jgi:hypothetical protein